MSGPARNDPCPCGSGKTFKKCCQATSGTTAGTGYTQSDRDLALAALDEFTTGPGWERVTALGLADFWGELEPATTAVANDEGVAAISALVFDFWLFFDHEYEPGRRVVDAFLEAARDLRPGMRSYLTLARGTSCRLYQVIEVRPGVGMTLRDLVTEHETRVAERSATQQIRRWDIVASRIIPAGTPGDPVLDGGVLPIRPERAEALAAEVREAIAADAREGAASEEDISAELGPAIHEAWIAPLETPQLVNYDGDPVVLTRVYFDVEDRAATVATLDAAKGLERVEEGEQAPRWAWSGKGKDRKEPVIYGWFSLREDRLEFETNSVERGERARRLVKRLVGGAVKYRVTSTEDVERAMDGIRERGQPR